MESDVEQRGKGIVEHVDPITSPRWAEVVEQVPMPLFVSPRWLSVLRDVYGISFRARVLTDGDRVTAGVAYAELDDIRGARVASLPFCDLAPALVPDHESWRILSQDLVGGPRPAAFRSLIGSVLDDDPRLDTTVDATMHVLALDDPETLAMGYSQGQRRMIRKAQRRGIGFRVTDKKADLRRFFELHLGVRKQRHRLLAQPYELFEVIWDRYVVPGEGALVIAEVDGMMTAGCLLCVHQDRAYYKFAASSPDHRDHGANHATVHAAATWAWELGLTELDLGRSDLVQPGLVAFKRAFGATERPLAIHRCPGTTDASNGRAAAVLGELTTLLTEPCVPDEITERAGALLYRWFA